MRSFERHGGGLKAELPGDFLWWRQVGQSPERVQSVILSNLESSDAELLAPLYGAGRVRAFATGSHCAGHFVWFERGDEVRFLLAPAALRASTMTGPGLWLYWQGKRDTLPDGLQNSFDGLRSFLVSHASDTGTLRKGRASPGPRL